MNNYRPNQHLIGVADSRNRLATPALILDLDALEHNVRRMAELCGQHGIVLRPHAKTHKCSRIALMQQAAGARGICAATVREAQVMLAAGIKNVLLTAPVVGEVRIGELISLAAGETDLSVVADNVSGLEELQRRFEEAQQRIRVFVDVDLGSMYRTGVASAEAALELARRIADSRGLEYGGVQFYSGIVQHIQDAGERADYYGKQLAGLRKVIDLLTTHGLCPPVVTGGGTGTIAIDAASAVITENQAGSYVVMDVEYGDVHLLPDEPTPFRSALFVQSSVISNNVGGMVTIDAGSKSLSVDGPSPRVTRGAPPDCTYQMFGDEFGVIIFPDAIDPAIIRSAASQAEPNKPVHKVFQEVFGHLKGEPGRLEVGTRLEMTAPHCDPTVNLYNHYHCVRGDTLVDIWPVDARGNL